MPHEETKQTREHSTSKHFLTRHPQHKEINPELLYDDENGNKKYLLPEELRKSISKAVEDSTSDKIKQQETELLELKNLKNSILDKIKEQAELLAGLALSEEIKQKTELFAGLTVSEERKQELEVLKQQAELLEGLTVYVNQDKQVFVFNKKFLLGEGAFGRVYVIQNAAIGKWHCIKQLKIGTFEEIELEILAKEGMYLSSDKDSLIFELLYGKMLTTVLKENKLSFEKALALSISTVEAYESLHRKGYVHRDIKPDNLMVLEKEKCVAIDLGTAAYEKEKTKQKGDVAYMPLEILQDKYNERLPSFVDDIYGIGLVVGRILSSPIGPISETEKQKNPLTKIFPERERYIQAMARYKRSGPFDSVEDVHDRIFPVILSLKSKERLQQLTPQKRELYQLICDMTGSEEHRPEHLDSILKTMRRIRKDYVDDKINTFPANGPYGILLKKLYDKRLLFLSEKMRFFETKIRPYEKRTPEEMMALMKGDALDDLYVFLLRAVDTVENRPSISEVQQYITELDKAFAQKKELEPKIVAQIEKTKLQGIDRMAGIEKIKRKREEIEKTMRQDVKIKKIDRKIELRAPELYKQKHLGSNDKLEDKALETLYLEIHDLDMLDSEGNQMSLKELKDLLESFFARFENLKTIHVMIPGLDTITPESLQACVEAFSRTNLQTLNLLNNDLGQLQTACFVGLNNLLDACPTLTEIGGMNNFKKGQQKTLQKNLDIHLEDGSGSVDSESNTGEADRAPAGYWGGDSEPSTVEKNPDPVLFSSGASYHPSEHPVSPSYSASLDQNKKEKTVDPNQSNHPSTKPSSGN